MDALRLSTMRLHPQDAGDKARVRAEKSATEFEQMFVRTMVSSLRQTSKLADGGMFGSGPGSDTFGDWFDQNLAEQIGRDGEIGIKQALLADLERNHELKPDPRSDSKLTAKFAAAKAAGERTYQTQTTPTLADGGFDVVL